MVLKREAHEEEWREEEEEEGSERGRMGGNGRNKAKEEEDRGRWGGRDGDGKYAGKDVGEVLSIEEGRR